MLQNPMFVSHKKIFKKTIESYTKVQNKREKQIEMRREMRRKREKHSFFLLHFGPDQIGP